MRPELAEGHFNLGLVLRGQGKLDDAVSCYRRAVELKPSYAEAYHQLGVALTAPLDEAIACYRRAIGLGPDRTNRINLGVALQQQWKLDEAVACHQRALQLKPDSAEIYNNLGAAYQARGELDHAADCYRRALELNCDSAEVYVNLGQVLKLQGKPGEADVCYQQALDTNPNLAEAHFGRGVLRLLRGDFKRLVGLRIAGMATQAARGSIGAAGLGRRRPRGKDYSAARRAGAGRYHSVYSLCPTSEGVGWVRRCRMPGGVDEAFVEHHRHRSLDW